MRSVILGAVAVAAAGALAGCASDDTSSSSGATTKGDHQTVAARISDAGCEPAVIEVAAGPLTFEVENTGTSKVTEFEVLKGKRILGEAENLAPGLKGRFSLTLQPGRYRSYCPGGDSSEYGTIVVSGDSVAGESATATRAVTDYRAYVLTQTADLVKATTAFAAAVKAGDVAKAKQLYATARIPYERIEPVAESFGDLDPRIDAREGDVPSDDWTGFHPLEKALWKTGSLQGTKALADTLAQDVGTLHSRIPAVDLEAAQVANGAVELLGEVSKSKITGEEERYSHIDLVDVQANVDGAQAAFDAVRPIVEASDQDLVDTIDERFLAMGTALDPFRTTGGNGFVSYTALTPAQTRQISRAVDALAEPLSRIGAIVVANG